MTAVPELPNRLFSEGRSVLSKFGYRHLEDGEVREDWAAMWEHLRSDFTDTHRLSVASFDRLNADQQAAAREYMSRRLLADRNLERCEEWHVKMFAQGINTDAVERYSVARDAYEESVEAFGAAREKLDILLPRNGEM
ncbi:MAG: hypothetical protein WCZ23_13570 [Rhodospirillaceae bacterium]